VSSSSTATPLLGAQGATGAPTGAAP
jgi:hypothetical protein